MTILSSLNLVLPGHRNSILFLCQYIKFLNTRHIRHTIFPIVQDKIIAVAPIQESVRTSGGGGFELRLFAVAPNWAMPASLL